MCLSRGQGSEIMWGGFGEAGGAHTLLTGFHSHLLLSPRTSSLFISAVAPERGRLERPSKLFCSAQKEAEKVIFRSFPLRYFLN